MNKPKNATYSVLLAEDSTDDRFLLRNALRRATQLQIVGEVGDGSEVVAYLNGREPYASRARHPLPDLLLLDLKMPQMDGFEVLEWLRGRSFPGMTVVVLTDSMQPEHVKRALDLGADLFQVKPRTNPEREAMALALEDFVSRNGKASLAFSGSHPG